MGFSHWDPGHLYLLPMVTRFHLHSSMNHFIFSFYILEKITKGEYFLESVGIWYWISLILVLWKKLNVTLWLRTKMKQMVGWGMRRLSIDFFPKRFGANIICPVDWSILIIPNIESRDATDCLIIYVLIERKLFPWAGWYLLSME